MALARRARAATRIGAGAAPAIGRGRAASGARMAGRGGGKKGSSRTQLWLAAGGGPLPALTGVASPSSVPRDRRAASRGTRHALRQHQKGRHTAPSAGDAGGDRHPIRAPARAARPPWTPGELLPSPGTRVKVHCIAPRADGGLRAAGGAAGRSDARAWPPGPRATPNTSDAPPVLPTTLSPAPIIPLDAPFDAAGPDPGTARAAAARVPSARPRAPPARLRGDSPRAPVGRGGRSSGRRKSAGGGKAAAAAAAAAARAPPPPPLPAPSSLSEGSRGPRSPRSPRPGGGWGMRAIGAAPAPGDSSGGSGSGASGGGALAPRGLVAGSSWPPAPAPTEYDDVELIMPTWSGGSGLEALRWSAPSSDRDRGDSRRDPRDRSASRGARSGCGEPTDDLSRLWPVHDGGSGGSGGERERVPAPRPLAKRARSTAAPLKAPMSVHVPRRAPPPPFAVGIPAPAWGVAAPAAAAAAAAAYWTAATATHSWGSGSGSGGSGQPDTPPVDDRRRVRRSRSGGGALLPSPLQDASFFPPMRLPGVPPPSAARAAALARWRSKRARSLAGEGRAPPTYTARRIQAAARPRVKGRFISSRDAGAACAGSAAPAAPPARSPQPSPSPVH